ncbi:MAG: DegT/DnrJ/EryC1/StrS family aminotransferase [Candidatus Tectomicrobia bacterium]|nr:DegT/DnrJ/EryC1/StrS family aminotransferase [Candidatus Tectomicrobia bacterium]
MAHLAIAGGTALRQAPFPAWPVWDETDVQALQRVLQSGRWDALKGEEVSQFEAEFAAFQGAAHAVAVTNGTVALKLALIAAGVGPGDEVIVPGYTFIATATAALELGAIPVFADVDPQSYTLDPESVVARLSGRTRAIMPVHLGGCPADMDGLLALSRLHGLAVVEDAAQAWGAAWNGTPVGTLGQCGIVSFHASKNLTAGEGGMVLCDDPDIASLVRSLSNCGRQPDGLWYAHYLLGGNYRLSEFQGAVLRSQLQRYPKQLARRQANAAYLGEALAAIDGVSPLTTDSRVTANAYHVYFLKFDAEEFGGIDKLRFIAALRAEGITDLHPGYSLPAYRQPVMLAKNFGLAKPPFLNGSQAVLPDYASVTCPVTEYLCDHEALWLRQNVLLGERLDLDDIVAAMDKVQRHLDEVP